MPGGRSWRPSHAFPAADLDCWHSACETECHARSLAGRTGGPALQPSRLTRPSETCKGEERAEGHGAREAWREGVHERSWKGRVARTAPCPGVASPAASAKASAVSRPLRRSARLPRGAVGGDALHCYAHTSRVVPRL